MPGKFFAWTTTHISYTINHFDYGNITAKAVEAAKAHYASCCVMVFHVVGFSCFSLKIGEMEIFHKTHNRLKMGSREWEKDGRMRVWQKIPPIKFSACMQQLKLKIWTDVCFFPTGFELISSGVDGWCMVYVEVGEFNLIFKVVVVKGKVFILKWRVESWLHELGWKFKKNLFNSWS